MFQACDMNMMTGTTNTGQSYCFDTESSNDSTDIRQIELLSTNNTTECANMEWVDYCSKLNISALQACDMDMVLDNRHTKESDDTSSKNMKEHVPTISQARSCSGTPQILSENHRSLATTSFSKNNLKVIVCLFILAVVMNTGFLSTSESFSSTLGNVQKVCLSKELEGRGNKQEAKHMVKGKRQMNLNKYLIKREVGGVVKESCVHTQNTNHLNFNLIRKEEENNTAVTTFGGRVDPLLEFNMASDEGLAFLKPLSTGRRLSDRNQAERKWA